jgi:hypothetical protein
MTTQTDLANAALAYLGEKKITDIDDSGSVPARTCKRFIDDTIKEELRAARWNCAIKRQTLSQISPTPTNLGDFYTVAYQLPADYMRILEVNGEPWEASQQLFEVENGQRLLSAESSAVIRYVALIEVHEMDPLLQKAIALQLAGKLAVPLSAKNDLQAQMLTFHQLVVSQARQVDAIEVGSREVSPYERLMNSSPLVNSRGSGWGNGLRYGRYRVPFT